MPPAVQSNVIGLSCLIRLIPCPNGLMFVLYLRLELHVAIWLLTLRHRLAAPAAPSVVTRMIPFTSSRYNGAAVPIPTFVLAVAPLMPWIAPRTIELLWVTVA